MAPRAVELFNVGPLPPPEDKVTGELLDVVEAAGNEGTEVRCMLDTLRDSRELELE